MPRAGGCSTKYGNRYEDFAVIYEIRDVLSGENSGIKLQAVSTAFMPGDDSLPVYVDDYIVIDKNGKRLYHQAKHAAPGGGSWTASKLISEGIITQFYKQYCTDLGSNELKQIILTTESESLFFNKACGKAIKAAVDVKDFFTRLCTDEVKEEWDKIKISLTIDDDELFKFCKKLYLEKLPLDYIKRDIKNWLQEKFSHPEKTDSILLDLVDDSGCYGSILRKYDILNWLSQKGIYPKTPLSSGDISKSLYDASSYLRQLDLIDGIHLDRPEIIEIIEWIKKIEKAENFAILYDIPGGGKSVIMRDLLITLENEGVPVLGIKSDRIKSISKREELFKELGLPDDVENIMSQMINPIAVVIIDQIDALSMSLSRDQNTLDLLLDLISRLRNIPGLIIITSCRIFDLHTDPKLSSIKVDKEFTLKPLLDKEINKVLTKIGIEFNILSPALKELVKVPLYLAIFYKIYQKLSGNDNYTSLSFKSLQGLYSELWSYFILKTYDYAPPKKERSDAIYYLVEYMHRNKQLSAPEGVMDNYIDAVIYLQREGILIKSGILYSFFHSTFFDYCYARNFVAKGLSISTEILPSEQGLFSRSQVIQILSYLRTSDFSSYLLELSKLIYAKNLRSHLYRLILEWLANSSDPYPEELSLLTKMMDDRKFQKAFLPWAMENPKWFKLFLPEIIPSMLQKDEDFLLHELRWYFKSAISHSPETIINILYPYAGNSMLWNNLIMFCLDELSDWNIKKALDILVNIIKQEPYIQHINSCLRNIIKSNPNAACYILKVIFDTRLNKIFDYIETDRQNKDMDKRIQNSINSNKIQHELFYNTETTLIRDIAKNNSKDFIDNFIPLIQKILVFLEYDQVTNIYKNDYLFSDYWYEKQANHPNIDFAKTLAEAVAQVATDKPEYFRNLMNDLINSDWMVFHRILIKGFLAASEQYFEEIYNYLTGDNRRFYVGDNYYDSFLLINTVFPYLTKEYQEKLEELLLNYETEWEKKNIKDKGRTARNLGGFIPEEHLSLQGRKRFEELKRKFPKFKKPELKRIYGGFVAPPIPPDSISKMTDEDWLRAMHKYNDNYDSLSGDLLKGGVYELSGVMIKEVEKDPERFYHLVSKFDEGISYHYLRAILIGLGNVENTGEYIYDLARRYSNHQELEIRSVLYSAINQKITHTIPDDIMTILWNYAINNAQEELPWQETNKEIYKYSDYHTTIRGRAINAYCRSALLRTPPDVETVFDLVNHIKNDPSIPVLVCVIEILQYLIQYNISRSIDVFEEIIKKHPELLDFYVTHYFLYYSLKEFKRIRPYIELLLESEDSVNQEAGARLCCIALFKNPEARTLVEKVMSGTVSMKVGAVKVFSHNMEFDDFREICKTYLMNYFFQSSEKQVLEEIGNCFRHLKSKPVKNLKDFIYAFLESPALHENYSPLVEYMQDRAKTDEDVALDVVECVINKVGDGLYNMQSSNYISGEDIVKILLVMYTHALNNEIKLRAMNLLDRLLESGSIDDRRALKEHDRQ